MFLKYLEPIFIPYRAVKNAIIRVRTTKGNFRSEVRRVQNFGSLAKSKVGLVQSQAQKVQGEAQKVKGQAQKVQGQVGKVQGQMVPMPGQAPAMQPAPGQMPGQAPAMQPAMSNNMQMQGAGAMPGAINPNPPIKKVGFFRRRKVCTQCASELDKTWDSCPYCAQAAAQQQPAAAGPKTQAFMVGGAGSRQLLGWLVPVDGPQRGELYTLSPQSMIGTEPTCHIVLIDSYMSSQHAEIKAEAGVWILCDLGSTNGTYVNDQRVTQHELVDNDFIRFGQCMVKFKSL